MRAALPYSLLVLSLVLACSCVRDGAADCGPTGNTLLLFRYTGDGTDDIFPKVINNTEVFIFGEDGILVKEYSLDKSDLSRLQGLRVELPFGTYDVVCWGNVFSNSMITDRGESGFIWDHLLQHPDEISGNPVKTMDSVYYARSRIVIQREGPEERTLDFVSAHIGFEVYMEGFAGPGFPGKGSDGIPKLILRNLSCGYDFDMRSPEGTSVYYPEVFPDKTGLAALALFKTVRFAEEEPLELEILDSSGAAVFTLSLRDFIKDNSIVVTGRQEVTISIRVIFDGMDVQVKIAEWNSEEVKPVF